MEQNHLTIILEDISSKFDLVLEGHEVLRQEIREVREESNARHDHTAFLLTTLNDKIDGVGSRLDTKIDTVESRLSARIDSVETQLSARIDSVETQLGKKIDAVATDLAAHRQDTEAHGARWQVREKSE